MSASVDKTSTFDLRPTSTTNPGAERADLQGRAHRPSKPRYDARMMTRAREHRAAGWSYAGIRTLLLSEFGCQPSHETVVYWTNDAYRKRKMARQGARGRAMKGASARVWARSPEAQAAFVRRLRAEGEPVSGIVRVCRVVFGGRWSRSRVLRLLGDDA